MEEKREREEKRKRTSINGEKRGGTGMKGEKERMATTTQWHCCRFHSAAALFNSGLIWSISVFCSIYFFALGLGIVTVLLCYSIGIIINKDFLILYNFAIHLSKAKKGLLKYPHFAINFSHVWIFFPPSYFNDSHSSNFPYLYHREIGRPLRPRRRRHVHP